MFSWTQSHGIIKEMAIYVCMIQKILPNENKIKKNPGNIPIKHKLKKK